MRFLLYYIFPLFFAYSLYGLETDASLVVVDFKYSRKGGIKICEVQHGINSVFRGDRISYGGQGRIAVSWLRELTLLGRPINAIPSDFADPTLRAIVYTHPLFRIAPSLKKLLRRSHASQEAELLIVGPGRIINLENLQANFPSLLVMDGGIRPYWKDKFSMNRLFLASSKLRAIRPCWKLYSKNVDPELILTELPCNRYVIKPRGTFKGYGVIIVEKKDLAGTLAYIFSQSRRLKQDPDPSYHYWADDCFDSFLVETYCPSDPVKAPHLGKGLYEPTYRMVFLLLCSKEEQKAIYLGGYCTFPKKSLLEGKTLNERHKALSEAPHYRALDPFMYAAVIQKLSDAMIALHRVANKD